MKEEQHKQGTILLNKISKHEQDIDGLKELLNDNSPFKIITFSNDSHSLSISSPDATNELSIQFINEIIDTLKQESEQFKKQFKEL